MFMHAHTLFVQYAALFVLPSSWNKLCRAIMHLLANKYIYIYVYIYDFYFIIIFLNICFFMKLFYFILLYFVLFGPIK